MKTFVELDKSVTAQVDASRAWGTIDIRLIVATKKPDVPDASTEEFDEEPDELLDGTGPLDSYLERPKGKGYVVFLVNGQRHEMLDESFVGRELGFKYLRARTLIVVDNDRLAPEAIAQLIQGSRQGFYKGEVFSAVLSKMISILKGDPDLKRLESDAEQEIAELKSGDEAVKNKLDQLIEGHHSAGSYELPQGGGATVAQSHGEATGAASSTEFVIEGDAALGTEASGPVLVIEPLGKVIRLQPNEPKSIKVLAVPQVYSNLLEAFDVRVDPAIPEFKILTHDSENGKSLDLLFAESEDFPPEDYPVILQLSCIGQFKGYQEPRLEKREIIISQRKPRSPKPPQNLRPIPTFLRVVSRQPIQLHAGGPATHVRLRWDGEDELVAGTEPKWRFQGRCTSHPEFPSPIFTLPRRGNFEAVLEVPEGFVPNAELTFQVEAIGPKRALLATSFHGVVTEPVEPESPRKISEPSAAIVGRRAPYILRLVTEPEWKTTPCWGASEWTGSESACYQEPTQSNPLVLIINEDCALLKTARDAMITRKLDEATIKRRVNNYTAHIAYHLWQMYTYVQCMKSQNAVDENTPIPDEEQLRGEINRVSATLINLMEQDVRSVASKGAD